MAGPGWEREVGGSQALDPCPQEGRTHRTLPGLLTPARETLEIPPLKSPRQAFPCFC